MTVLGWIIIILGAFGSFILGGELADRYSDFNVLVFSCGIVSSVVLGSLFLGLGKIIELLTDNKNSSKEIHDTLKNVASNSEKKNPSGDNSTEKILNMLTETNGKIKDIAFLMSSKAEQKDPSDSSDNYKFEKVIGILAENRDNLKEIYNYLKNDSEKIGYSSSEFSTSFERILVLLAENSENTGKLVNSINAIQGKMEGSDSILLSDSAGSEKSPHLSEELNEKTGELIGNQEETPVAEQETASARASDFNTEFDLDLFADFGEFLEDDFQLEASNQSNKNDMPHPENTDDNHTKDEEKANSEPVHNDNDLQEIKAENQTEGIKYGINPKGEKAVYLNLSYLKNMGTCPICGSIQRRDRHLCYSCKTPFMYEEEPENTQHSNGDIPIRTKLCPVCGTMNGKNKIFCVMCGEKLD